MRLKWRSGICLTAACALSLFLSAGNAARSQPPVEDRPGVPPPPETRPEDPRPRDGEPPEARRDEARLDENPRFRGPDHRGEGDDGGRRPDNYRLPGMPGLGPQRGGGAGMTGAMESPPDPELEKLNSKELELTHRTTHLVRKYHNAAGGDEEVKEKTRAELLAAIEAHFDVRQERRKLQLKRIEETLERLREAIDSREEARESIIERRYGELVGERTEPEF